MTDGDEETKYTEAERMISDFVLAVQGFGNVPLSSVVWEIFAAIEGRPPTPEECERMTY